MNETTSLAALRNHITLQSHGSIVLMCPTTEDARTWLEDHTPDATWYAGALVVEPRYVDELLYGLLEGVEAA